MRPEAAAVLAHAPAFAFEAAFFGRRRERALRPAGQAILFGVKTREILTDDFRRLVALDPLRAGIPARYDALRVDHVDRIVGDCIDEETVTRLIAERCQRSSNGSHENSP